MVTERTSKNKLRLSVDARFIIIILLAIIIGMIVFWKPWQDNSSSGRTIQVTGEATLTAEPDEFVFYPSYQFTDADKNAALSRATEKSEEIVTKLKEIGVADSKIKTDTNGYDKGAYSNEPSASVYTAQITVTVGDRTLAQKVQDYLATTSPQGRVTPQASFSESKRKELESTARDEATKDAREKADQSAKNLGFKIGKVKEISDDSGFDGGPIPLSSGRSMALDIATSAPALQPGENNLNYSVTVTYFIN